MLDSELLQCVENSVKNAITNAFDELGIANKIKKPNEQNAFKKVEQLLWNYPFFNQIIQDKEEQIAEILQYGLRTKSKSITEWHGTVGSTVQVAPTVQDTVQEVVDALQHDIVWIKQCLERVELALDTVRNEADYPMLTDYYFERFTREQLAEKYGLSVPTVAKRKNALVRKASMYLFPKDALSELMI